MTYVIESKEFASINNLIISRQRLRYDVGTSKLPSETTKTMGCLHRPAKSEKALPASLQVL